MSPEDLYRNSPRSFIDKPQTRNKPNIHKHVNDKHTVGYPDNGTLLHNLKVQTLTHTSTEIGLNIIILSAIIQTTTAHIGLHVYNILASAN